MSQFDEHRPIRKTCRRYNDPGHAHALTFSCFHRQPFLSRDLSRTWLIHALERARERHHFDLWAWVIMPEHVHLVLCPRHAEYSVSAVLTSIKQSTARRALTYVKREAPDFLSRMEDRQPNGKVSHRFWQRGGGFDGNLTEPKTVWKMIDYIHANPVRRGLCERPVDWKWSSAVEFEHPGTGLLKIDRESLPR